MTEADIEELQAEVRCERRYRRDYLAAPDCRDPDHPGCPLCEQDDDTDDE